MTSARRIRLTIRDRMLLSFAGVILAGLAALLLVSVRITEQNVARMIAQDAVQAKKTLDLSVRQYFLTKNLTLDRDSLEAEAAGLEPELSAAVGGTAAVFGSLGEDWSAPAGAAPADSDDFNEAQLGNTAYSVLHAGSSASLVLSSPVESGGSIVGVIRVVKDESALHDFAGRFLGTVRWFTAAIFALVFLTAAWLSGRIARPLGRLANSVQRVAEGRYEPVPVERGSGDEISELSLAFNRMVGQIREQIAMIERERDALQVSQAMTKSFFDHVTHELKTPLTTIRGYAQMLRENGFTDRPFFDKGLNYIIEESGRLNDKVVQILALSTAESDRVEYRFEPVDLTGLVRNACEDMNVKARKFGVEIRFESAGEHTVRGDREKLRELFLNILDNAIKYGGLHTTVAVTVEASEKDGARVRVDDQGPGIPEEHLQHLFEPFYRAGGVPKERGSAGLGLAIVKTIAERHGGKVDVRSKPGAGTSLTVELGGEDHA